MMTHRKSNHLLRLYKTKPMENENVTRTTTINHASHIQIASRYIRTLPQDATKMWRRTEANETVIIIAFGVFFFIVVDAIRKMFRMENVFMSCENNRCHSSKWNWIYWKVFYFNRISCGESVLMDVVFGFAIPFYSSGPVAVGFLLSDKRRKMSDVDW